MRENEREREEYNEHKRVRREGERGGKTESEEKIEREGARGRAREGDGESVIARE